MWDVYLDGVVVGLAGLSVGFVRHEPGLQQVLIETVSKTPHRCVIWRARARAKVRAKARAKAREMEVTEKCNSQIKISA